MATLKPQRLREVKTLEDVLQYLSDELDWPITSDDLEASTYDWDPDELGISAELVPRLESLRQLRPMTANQPWGVFFLEFSGPRLPITPLRRLLQGLVARKRVSAKSETPTWRLDDLLFIITTDSGDSVELHFLAFFDEGGPSVVLRSLPWRPEQSPNQHLKRLASELLPHLEWPTNTDDIDAWRREWREAFKLRLGEVIRSATTLAERMAKTATDLREQIAEAIRDERGSGPFSRLLGEVRKELVSDADGERFADMCAQTLVYGVLSSRVTDPVAFGASPTLSSVPLSNPFLEAFFEQVHDEALALDLEGSGLEQLVADLRESNVEAILDDFGSTAKGGDPVIHFYEEFLKQYDKKLRADAGAFYTPQPIVDFMVSTVDSLLRSRFGLEMGVADNSSWATVASRIGFEVPAGVDPESPFLSMLDPATGTGTFLVSWLRQARESFLAKHSAGEWAEHLRDHVLPAMHAFELMLGPYAIAHLKVALELHDEGVSGGNMCVLLTDTLDYSTHELKFETMMDPVATEGERAGELKASERFTVVIGNPPYDRENKEEGDTGKRKGGVVRYGVKGVVKPLLQDVIAPMKAADLGRHVKNLYNDYVYFWRWAAWQATEHPPGPGIVAFITASSYLDGKSMGGLRSFLRREFDELLIVDLGGEGRGALPEENVFEILTPVAIAFAVRHGRRVASDGDHCEVRYLRIRGNREEKLNALNTMRLASEEMAPIAGSGLDILTPRSESEYANWPEIAQLFPVIYPGTKAGRTWVIGESESLLKKRLEVLLDATPREREDLFKDSPTGRKAADKLGRSNMPGSWNTTPIRTMKESPGIVRYGYRSFDRQFIVHDPRFLDRPSASWALAGHKQLYLTTLTSTKLGRGPVLTVTPYVPDLDFFRGSYGAKNVMPLYRDHEGRVPNVTKGLLDTLGESLGRAISAEDLVAYVHALLGTSAFGDSFGEILAEGAGPVHVPLTSNAGLFARAVELGRDLLWWHSWGERFTPLGAAGNVPSGSAQELEEVRGYPERYSYDVSGQLLHVGDGLLGPVREDVWAFEVSGLKVLQSWLGYRMKVSKGRKSSPLDNIRPTRWTFTPELLQLLAILEHTIDVTSVAGSLIAEIIQGPLLLAADLPSPAERERKAP